MSNDVTIVVRSDNQAAPGMAGAKREMGTLDDAVRKAGDRARESALKLRELSIKATDAGRAAQEASAKWMTAQLRAAQLKDTSEKTARELAKLGTAAELAGVKAEQAGERQRRAANDAGRLARAYDELADQARQAAASMAVAAIAPGPTVAAGGRRGHGGGLDFGGAFRDAAGMGADAAGAGARLGSSLGRAAAPVVSNPYVAGAAVVAGASAAPFLGAAAGGAVIGGAALGAVGAGVAAAADSERVRAAYGSLLEDLRARWQAGGDMFEQPLVEAAGRFKAAMADVDLEGMFRRASQFVEPLADGLARGAQSIGQGLTALVEDAGPVVDSLSRGAAQLGDAFGDAFAAISDGSEGGARAIDDLVNATAMLIRTTGQAIGFFEDWYAAATSMRDAVPILRELWELDEATAYGQVLGETSDALRDVGDAAGDASRSVFELKFSMDALLGNTLDARAATRAYEQSLDELTEGIRENGRSLDVTTEAGRRNQANIDETIDSLRRKRQADIDAAGGTEEATARANAAYLSQLEHIRATLRANGMLTDEINGLIDAAARVPHDVTTKMHLQGAEQAAGSLSFIAAALARIPRSVTTTVRTVTVGPIGGSFGSSLGNLFRRRATGGVTGGLTLINEGRRGPTDVGELVRLPEGSMVYSAPQSRTMAERTAAPPSAAANKTTLVLDTAGSRLDQMLLEVIRHSVRAHGGDVQLVLGGRPS